MDKPPYQATPTLDQIRDLAAQSAGSPPRPPGIVDPTLAAGQEGVLAPSAAPGGVPGVGSAYKANQEISGGKISPATEEGLAALQRERDLEKARKEAEDTKQKDEEARANAETRMLAELGGFDFDTFRSLVADNPFLNKELKEHIEANLAPISIKDLILGRGRQLVIIIPGKLEVLFQTPKGKEDLLVKLLMRKDADQLSSYFEDKKAMLNLAIGLEEINGQPMPVLEDPEANGLTTEKTLLARFNALLEMSIQMIAFMAVNYGWFDSRVKKTLTPQNLKNG